MVHNPRDRKAKAYIRYLQSLFLSSVLLTTRAVGMFYTRENNITCAVRQLSSLLMLLDNLHTFQNCSN